MSAGATLGIVEFEPFFGREPGVVWAADVEPDTFAEHMENIGDVDGLVGVKIGFEVALGLGLKESVRIVRANTNAKAQYDHQKAGNDIDATSMNYLRAMVRGGIDSTILFPFTGPVAQKAWTEALLDEGINVFTGMEMTHDGFSKDENGSIDYIEMNKIFGNAVTLGVDHFIVPGNKPDRVEFWRKAMERAYGIGNFAMASPGLISQGGDITASGEVAGEFWTPIIGRGVHANETMTPRQAIEFYAGQQRKAKQ